MARFTDTIKNIFDSGIEGFEKFKMGHKFYKANSRTHKKKIFWDTFEQVPREDAKEFYSKVSGYQMTTKTGILGSLGVAGAIAGQTGLAIEHDSKLGYVEVDKLANTVTHNVSPILEKAIAEGNEEMLTDSFGKSQYGVEPNIVFALHQLRN